ncbi:MAG: hypothetical protein A3B47_01720 [Candidatus Levybacteria bacterium RIFCSPLOWO2_01_FULL_39_24]|nr:MAG: hypothetical protein A2800_00355 [Candidatus Levybacteria bacterium RIFCSPHIGHO2_01_FULL_40_16]OGH27927.1 MAG: hypothetical protein A3E12_02280 [Candidatus Levybacteria bacterium RIFCSPHIGHO2_12_FULL_39_9]OGH46835.1 MAG: hypothetical protein A3B47_01720 [Candidatus Levybacteria bacterium RIFCSPLOWO2_01_FULL_39_24]
MNYAKLLPILIEAASFISAFAAIAAAVIMARFIRRFVTGILSMGFRTIGIGVFVLALGIIIDAIEIYVQASNNPSSLSLLLIVRQVFFVLGAYIIVIGSKNMGDKLETLSKHKSA